MRSSLSRIKKFLGPSPSIESSQTHSAAGENLTETKRNPSIPEIICENEDLKQRVKYLERQKQLLEILVRNSQPRQPEIRIQQSPVSRKSVSRQSNNIVVDSYQPKQSTTPRDSSSHKHEDKTSSQYTKQQRMLRIVRQRLEEQEQKNRKLELKIMRLNVLFDNQEKQKKMLLNIIQQLRNKLQESTQYILKNNRPHNPQTTPNPQLPLPHISTSQTPIQEIDNTTTLNAEIQCYKNQLKDYYEVKDHNYRLRDRVAELMFSNQVLHQKAMGSSKAIQHLWKIKEIQTQNLSQCLREMMAQ